MIDLLDFGLEQIYKDKIVSKLLDYFLESLQKFMISWPKKFGIIILVVTKGTQFSTFVNVILCSIFARLPNISTRKKITALNQLKLIFLVGPKTHIYFMNSKIMDSGLPEFDKM